MNQSRKTIDIHNPRVWLIGSIVFVIFIIVIYLISVLFHSNPYGPEIKIDNLTQLISNLPEERRDAIQNALYSRVFQVKDNEKEIPRSGALVREGTVTTNYNSQTNVYTGDFLVDIEELQLSYRIRYEWSPEANNPNLSGYTITLSCPSDKQNIYPDFVCDITNDYPNDTSPEAMLFSYTPHYATTTSGDTVYIVARRYSNGNFYAEVNINACGNTVKIEEAKQATETWLKSIGVDATKVPFEIRNLCQK